ncbi:hypothetical protein TeGR_g1018 [Tetraparma gracilis]|uniref:Uncharacterized protein n=1 Tax=Tetraparma gracilis TaxID=2962635 RepID=A0ABQ6MZZ9_9STRA|nr:hypothetical protein TeGR_g1018 [Tetraparma gracilis]
MHQRSSTAPVLAISTCPCPSCNYPNPPLHGLTHDFCTSCGLPLFLEVEGEVERMPELERSMSLASEGTQLTQSSCSSAKEGS